MEHIRQLVISNKEPKDVYVGWLKPQPDGKYLLYFYNRGEWFNILEHLESRLIFNHIDKTATLAGIIQPNSTPKDTIFPVFYIAKEAGIYSYFDEIKVDNPSILYKVNGKWEAAQLSIDISSIQDNSIPGSKIQNDSISENKIIENSIGNNKIQENTITENKLSLELQEKINNSDLYAKLQDLLDSNKRIENLEAIDHSKYLTEHQSLEGLATENYVNGKVADIISSAPETLDTLNELAIALGNDPNFATTIATQLGNKVDKVAGKSLVLDTEITKIHEHNNKDLLDTIVESNIHTHDNKAVIDAITSVMTTKWNKSIPFEDSYVLDCNTWLTNGYTKTNKSTTNLPSVCIDEDRYGILFYISENNSDGTGTQMYFPINGTYAGKVFIRSIRRKIPVTWSLLSTFDGDYNNLINKPTIPSEYILPTASTDTLGGIKVGAGLIINDGVLSANGGGTADSVDWSNVQNKPTIPSKTSDLTNDSGFISDVSNLATKEELNNVSSQIPSTEGLLSKSLADSLYQEKGNYLTEHQSLDAYYNKNEVDDKLSRKLDDAPAVIKRGAINTNAVETDNIVEGAVTQEKLGTASVTSDKIADGAVLEKHLGFTLSDSTLLENSVTLTEINENIIPYNKSDIIELLPFNSARLRNKFIRSYRDFNTNGEAENFDSLYIDIKTNNPSLYPSNITANLLRYIKVRRLSARMLYNSGLLRTDRIHGYSYNNWVLPKLYNPDANSDKNVTLINTINLEKTYINNSMSYKLDLEVLKLFIILYLKEEEHDIPSYTAYNATLGTSPINITPYIDAVEILGITYPVNIILKYNPKKIIITNLNTSDNIEVSEVKEQSVENIYTNSKCKLKLLNAKLNYFSFGNLYASYTTNIYDIYIYINSKAPDFFRESYIYYLQGSMEGYSASKTADNYYITNLIEYCNKKQLVLLGFPMFKWGHKPIKPKLKNGIFMYEFTIGIQHPLFGLVPINAILYYSEESAYKYMFFRFKNSSEFSTCSINPY